PGERGEVGTSALPAATRDSYDDFRGPSGAAPPLLTGEGWDEAWQIVSYSLAARRGGGRCSAAGRWAGGQPKQRPHRRRAGGGEDRFDAGRLRVGRSGGGGVGADPRKGPGGLFRGARHVRPGGGRADGPEHHRADLLDDEA